MPIQLTTLRALALFLGAIPFAAQAQARDSAGRNPVVQSGAPSVRAESVSVTAGDVSRRAVDVFGESLETKAAPDSSAGPTWDMDVRSYATQERVAHYVNVFTGRSRQHITERLGRGTRYEPMIRSTFRAHGVPEDMYYLALVESGFDPHAYSRAAAVGMWQFMTSTGRDMGLRVDWWVDERRDPVKSTIAAAKFIRELRDQFGSLYLAAAAYNGGPGRIARGLTRYADDLDDTQGDDAFFVLAEKDYLKNETREYVPQLIAAALIAKEPVRYGMELRQREPFAYDSVTVPASTPLAAVAKAAGVALSEVKDLNTHFLRGMTPPMVKSQVRVPVGTAAGFDCAFAELPAADHVATRTVETKKGDTVDRLAERAGVSSSAVAGFNAKLRRLKSGRLAPGQVVVIPTAAVAAAALNIPDPGIEKYPSSSKRVKVHTVKRGESVGVIAQKYGLSTAQVIRLNGLKKPMIFAGQTLLVAGSSKANVKSGKTSVAKVAKGKVSKAKVSKAKVSKAKVSKAKVSKANVSKAKVAKAKVAKAKVAKARTGSRNAKAK